MSLVRAAARRLRIGKYKHFQGTDLNGAPVQPCCASAVCSLTDIIAFRLFFRTIDRPQGTSSSSVRTPRHQVSGRPSLKRCSAALADLAPPRLPHRTDEWRQAKRYVEYLKAEPLSEYGYKSIPGALDRSDRVCAALTFRLAVQWSSWLRRTRRDPPTLEELQSDLQRQLKLQENVRRLEQEYREEKMRLAEAHQAALLQAPDAVRGAVARDGASGAGVEQGAEPSQEGLPLKDGGAGEVAGKRAAEIARRVGTGEGTPGDDATVPEGATPEEMAETRRRQEREAAMKRRAEFGQSLLRLQNRAPADLAIHAAKQNATPLRGNPGDAHQPAGWTPSAPARRRN
jgi:NADH dehydrogenase [ubiquinone] 1 alpha subcomplex assembly factor 2